MDIQKRFDDLGEFAEKANAQEQRVVFICLLLDQVENGGLVQWLTNPSGDFVEETCKALIAIGFGEAAREVQSY